MRLAVKMSRERPQVSLAVYEMVPSLVFQLTVHTACQIPFYHDSVLLQRLT